MIYESNGALWSVANDDRCWNSNSNKSKEVQSQKSITMFASKEVFLNRIKSDELKLYFDKMYKWDQKLAANLVEIFNFLSVFRVQYVPSKR